jgi:glycosyltransferase involved in cell wall biosynthesis
MDYRPNADAARQLIDVVMPFVWREIPDARVAIVGRDPAPDLVARARRPGVVVTGYVEDIRPYLEGAAVFAAPLRFASGIQNKLLEAMAMSVPVVTTPVAAAGLRGDDGRAAPLNVAREPADLGARIVERLRASATDPTPDAAARRFVQERFSWAASGRSVDAILGAVIDDRGSHRRC